MTLDMSSIDFGPILEKANKTWLWEKNEGECRPDQYYSMRYSCVMDALMRTIPKEYRTYTGAEVAELIQMVENLMGPY